MEKTASNAAAVQPATALPKRIAVTKGHGDPGLYDERTSESLTAAQAQEVLRRVDAYPQLVAALREFTEATEPLSHSAYAANFRALLRTLGEA